MTYLSYPVGNLLIEPPWLAEHSADKNLRIVDMRSEKAYTAGHIPGAVRLVDKPLRNPEERFTHLPRPEVFTELMNRAGIGNQTDVVIYDDEGGKLAARLWYLLHAFGHNRSKLLNGGWQKWTAQNLPDTVEVPSITPAAFRVREIPDMTCALPQFLSRKPGVVVLDTRSPDEYSAKIVSPGAKQEGRVPGAINVEWKENITGPNLEFKPARELLAMYAAKGITPSKEIVVYCASGGRASQTLFTLRLLDFKKVKVYYGSFADYSALPNVPIDKDNPVDKDK
jgi:thiosulfate/3-mercaptopyruvate sulfurtransferase